MKRVIWQNGDSWRLEVQEVGGQEKATVDHPGAVVLLPLLPDGRVMMLRQYRLALAQTILELPAGTRHWAEEWLLCAQRELQEETGYRAEQFNFLGEIWPLPGSSNELMHLYLAQGLTADPLPADEDEEIELAFYPLGELVEMALDGRLMDAKSVVAILRAAHYLQKVTPTE